jgi:hypothetical protein
MTISTCNNFIDHIFKVLPVAVVIGGQATGDLLRKIQLQVASVFQQQAQDARISTEGCQLKVDIKMLFSSVIITAFFRVTQILQKEFFPFSCPSFFLNNINK